MSTNWFTGLPTPAPTGSNINPITGTPNASISGTSYNYSSNSPTTPTGYSLAGTALQPFGVPSTTTGGPTTTRGGQTIVTPGSTSTSTTTPTTPTGTVLGGATPQRGQSTVVTPGSTPTTTTPVRLNATPLRGQSTVVTPGSTPTTSTTGTGQQQNAYTAPAVPTFAPTSYVQTTSPQYGGTSTQPTLDSYLASSVNSLYNPSSIENGTAIGDPTNMLTSLANNYLALNPGTGNQADIQNLVNQYAQQYNTWAGQYQQYLKNEGGNISLPAGSPYAQAGSAAANTPAPANPYAAPPNTANNTQINTNNTNSNSALQALIQQYLGSSTTPQSSTVTTPLGYTQYQNSTPQTTQSSTDAMTQLILQYLMGQSQAGGSQTSFSQLLQ